MTRSSSKGGLPAPSSRSPFHASSLRLPLRLSDSAFAFPSPRATASDFQNEPNPPRQRDTARHGATRSRQPATPSSQPLATGHFSKRTEPTAYPAHPHWQPPPP